MRLAACSWLAGLADCLVWLLQLLRMFVKGMTHCLSDLEVVSLAEMAHGHVGGDLKAVCLEGRATKPSQIFP